MIRRLCGALALLAGVCMLGGCTSTSSGHPQVLGTPSPSPVTSSSPPSDPATTASPSPASTTPASTSAAPSTTRTGGASTPACTLAQLSVGVLRGGAIAGSEIAGITFTNSSTAPCSLTGFPGVSLRLNGALLGSPAGRTSTPIHTVVLAPGAQAQTQLTDYSTCQAPLSDTIRIYPPNLTGYVERPIALRGCALVVAPVALS